MRAWGSPECLLDGPIRREGVSQSASLMAQSLRASPCVCVALFVMQNVLVTSRPQDTGSGGPPCTIREV